MEEQQNLRQRMAAAMADIGTVKKKGKNPTYGYKFAQAEDILVEVRAALLKHGIVFLSSELETKRLPDRESAKGGTIFMAEVKMQFTLLDTTSDEKLVGDHSGEAMDSGDKCINKAKTAALKYFLQQTFLIPTGDDPENDDHDVKKVDNAAPKNGARKDNKYIGGGEGGPVASPGQMRLLDISAERKKGANWAEWLDARLEELHTTRATLSIPHFQMLVNELNTPSDDSQIPPPEDDIGF